MGAALREAVIRAVEAARARRPKLKWDATPLVTWLLEQVGDAAQLEALHVDDLLLARAAAAQDRAALEALEREVISSLRGVMLRVNPSDAFADDALQEVRQRLLVGPPPRLSAYTGKGALKSWARALAAGVGLDLVRKVKPHREEADEDAAAIELNAAGAGVDLELLKARHARQFSAALKGAMAALTPHERTVLRMRFIDGLTREEIGTFFKVHRTTALRWLEKAQATLLEHTRKSLQQQLSLSRAEVESLVRYLESGVGQSVLGALKSS